MSSTGRSVLWCRSFHELRGAWLWWFFMSSTSDRSAATMMCWMKKTTDAVSDTARKESVQVALLQTHGEDGASLLMRRWSLIGVSSVHFVQMCWEIDQVFLYLSSHDFFLKKNLSESDREFLQNPFWYISFLNYGRRSAPFVLQFSHDDCHEVAPFWWHSSGLREYPIAIGEYVGWIYFLSRDVHKCSKLCLDFNKQGILSTALWELFRITRIALHCPCHESPSLIFHKMGCRHHFVADRLEDLVDEGDCRSSSRVREHENFRLVSQLHVAIQRPWSRCLSPRAGRTDVHQRVAPTRSASTSWSVSLSFSKRSTDKLVLSQPSEKRVSISCRRSTRAECRWCSLPTVLS